MRTVISTEGSMVAAHFGRCPSFTIVDIGDGAVQKKEEIENPGHQPGFLPEFFRLKGVNCIVAGGMGVKAKMMFSDHDIETVIGVSGGVDDVIAKLCDGSLQGGESLCTSGEGHGHGDGECGHGECDH